MGKRRAMAGALQLREMQREMRGISYMLHYIGTF
jgi:hypothetical protein